MRRDGSCSHLCHGGILALPQTQRKDYRLFEQCESDVRR